MVGSLVERRFCNLSGVHRHQRSKFTDQKLPSVAQFSFQPLQVRPEWRLLDQFITSELQAVFSMDALQTSHRISAEVDDTNEIQDIFDQISYSKAATIIRMMDDFLTTETLTKGLTNFLNERKYGSATQDDLWETLTEQAHDDGVLEEDVTVKEIMDTWTLQTGYPVVNVTRDYEDGPVVMRQQRFFLR